MTTNSLAHQIDTGCTCRWMTYQGKSVLDRLGCPLHDPDAPSPADREPPDRRSRRRRVDDQLSP
jgi:hypothetical protein